MINYFLKKSIKVMVISRQWLPVSCLNAVLPLLLFLYSYVSSSSAVVVIHVYPWRMNIGKQSKGSLKTVVWTTGLCGWLGISFSEHIQEVNKDMLCNCDLNWASERGTKHRVPLSRKFTNECEGLASVLRVIYERARYLRVLFATHASKKCVNHECE